MRSFVALVAEPAYSKSAMNCRTWENLFEEYERATLERVARAKNRFLRHQPAELDDLNVDIANALRNLREHERQHGCR